MNRNTLSLSLAIASILIVSPLSNAQENEKKLTFYRDVTAYQEIKTIEENTEHFTLNLVDTAVLESLNITMQKNNEMILPKSFEVYEKSEENILKLNEGEPIFVNGLEYTLVNNGVGFLKLKTQDGLITYIPKNKIDVINFKKDITAKNHIAKINLKEKTKGVQVDFRYLFGMMDWNPSYDFYIKDDKKIQLDYFIEVTNNTLNTFEDVKMEIVVDDIELKNKNFSMSEQGGMFDYWQKVIYLDNREKEKKNNGFNTKGFERISYDKEGYNATGYDPSGYNSNKRYEEGVEIFSLPNNLTISPKSKSIHPYLETIELDYKKYNYYNFSSGDFPYQEDDGIGKSYITTSQIEILNKERIPYKSGIASLYSKEKTAKEKVLLKEFYLSEKTDDESVFMNLGYNSELLLKTKSHEHSLKSEEIALYYDKEDLREYWNKVNKYEDLYEFEESEGTKRLKEFYVDIEIVLSKYVYEVINNGNEKELIFPNSRFFEEKNIEKLNNLIAEFKSLELKYRTKKAAKDLYNKLIALSSRGRTINIKESEDIKLYQLKVDINEINFDNFMYNKNDIPEEENFENTYLK